LKKIKSYDALPEGYVQDFEVDMKTNKKLFLLINFGTIILMLPFIVVYGMIKDLMTFEIHLVNFLLFVGLMIALIVIHELIHGIFFKLGTKKKIKFGFHGFAASAGAPDIYFTKRFYLIIGLAPAIILNFTLLIICLFIKEEYFGIIYFNLAIHFAGCIGDFYIALKLIKYNKETLIEDKGISMKFFVRKEIVN